MSCRECWDSTRASRLRTLAFLKRWVKPRRLAGWRVVQWIAIFTVDYAVVSNGSRGLEKKKRWLPADSQPLHRAWVTGLCTMPASSTCAKVSWPAWSTGTRYLENCDSWIWRSVYVTRRFMFVIFADHQFCPLRVLEVDSEAMEANGSGQQCSQSGAGFHGGGRHKQDGRLLPGLSSRGGQDSAAWGEFTLPRLLSNATHGLPGRRISRPLSRSRHPTRSAGSSFHPSRAPPVHFSFILINHVADTQHGYHDDHLRSHRLRTQQVIELQHTKLLSISIILNCFIAVL